MKALLCVVLIAFVSQASAQTVRSLFCVECTDCPRVEATAVRRQCYGPATDPTRVTQPVTIGLTPPTVTTVGPVTPTTVASNQQQQVQSDEESLIDTYISPFQTTPLYQCFTVRARIGDRDITSRGCALISPAKDTTCLQQNQGEQPDFCYLCDENECNVVGGVTKMFAPLTLIFAALFITLRLY